MQKDAPKWLQRVLDICWENWQYRAPSARFAIKIDRNPKLKVWEIWAAPCVQELYGGAKDGEKFWPPFIFDVSSFTAHDDITITSMAVGSTCTTDDNFSRPQLMLRGKLQHGKRSYKFFLRVLLEPDKNIEPMEIIDTIKQEVRVPRHEQ
jgi:hypothetical protein